MSEALLIALIPSTIAFVGTLITLFAGNKKLINNVQKENTKVVNDIKLEITAYHAATDEKIRNLTEEVKKHNNFAQKMPKLEERIESINNKIDYLHK